VLVGSVYLTRSRSGDWSRTLVPGSLFPFTDMCPRPDVASVRHGAINDMTGVQNIIPERHSISV